MGTRAAFWLGDPRDPNSRQWLGCVSFDGYPSGFEVDLRSLDTGAAFLKFVKDLSKRSDFASPQKGWPYPWDDDIFMTDYNYAFFGDTLQVACFHQGFVPIAARMSDNFEWPDTPDMAACPAPTMYNPSQPDSIMIFGRPPQE